MKRVSDIDLRLLRVFVAVVEAGGYAAAQTSLNISTSSISSHMSDLEVRLGFRLCTRGRGGFSLTEQGREAYGETKRLMGSMADYVGRLAELRSELAGRLVLGTVDALITHPAFPFVEALRRFNELDHQVHIELLISSRDELERGVLDGRINAAVVPYFRPVDGLHFKSFFKERHELYCGRLHPLFSYVGASIPESELVRRSYVLRGYQADFDRARFVQAEYQATVQTMEGMLALLLTGSYLGFLPDHYAADWVKRGELRAINSESLGYTSNHMLVLPTTRKLSFALSKFLGILNAV